MSKLCVELHDLFVGNQVIVAVKMQSDIIPQKVKFPQGELLKVKPTKDWLSKEGSNVDTPVYDTQFQVNLSTPGLGMISIFNEMSTNLCMTPS